MSIPVRNQDEGRKSPLSSAVLDVAIVFLAIAYALSIMPVIHGRPDMDFSTYYFSSVALGRGIDIYDISAVREMAASMGYAGHIPVYHYPPTLAFLFSPLTLFDVVLAFRIWAFLNQIAFWLVLSLYYLASEKRGLRDFRHDLLIFLLFIVYLFVSSASGQVVIVILLSLVLFYYAVKANRSILAGVSLGLSTMIKPVAILFYPYLLFKKEFKVLSVALATVALSSLFLVFHVGWDIPSYFDKMVFGRFLSGTSIESYFVFMNADVFTKYRFFAIIAFLSLIYLACRNIPKKRSKLRFDLEYAFLMTSILALTTFPSYYNYVYAIPVFWILYDKRGEFLKDSKIRYLTLAISVGILIPLIWVTLFSTIALWLLLLYLIFKLK